ncbi:tyrosine-type recombinase/integrase [Rhodoplanes sp. SY1]|uniref:tyrosine-type recombinase/integrase n=1 Tax=Rhodoplanes sp. SY1 TaxID=3166646 RepID=UPI0038B633F1
MSLTDAAIRAAKPRDKPFKLSDGGGLYLVVSPSGGKLWRLKYRYLGREKLLSFGPYPLLQLAEARRRRDDAKRLLLDGTDPSIQKKQDRLAAEAATRNTFGIVAEEYIANKEANEAASMTVKKLRWLLQDLAAPLANRPIADIKPAEILDVLRRVEKSGRRESARRLRGAIGSVFRLAIVTLRAEADPTLPLKGALQPPKVQHRPAIVDEKHLGALMNSIDEYDGWPTLTAALKLTALTCARPGEVRGTRREEIDFEKARWRIPAERLKMRRPHDVPLSQQAMAVLKEIWPLSDHGELVFPSIRSNRRPLSENAMNSALRRMGYEKDEMTAHGFRSSASTILNARGFDPDVIEAALGHQDENVIRRIYNRATYWPERVKLMQAWADLLDDFRSRK